jgi:hypothetical protein
MSKTEDGPEVLVDEDQNSHTLTPGRVFGHGTNKSAGGGGFQAILAQSARQTVPAGQF